MTGGVFCFSVPLTCRSADGRSCSFRLEPATANFGEAVVHLDEQSRAPGASGDSPQRDFPLTRASA
jgi:hypothetical protein